LKNKNLFNFRRKKKKIFYNKKAHIMATVNRTIANSNNDNKGNAKYSKSAKSSSSGVSCSHKSAASYDLRHADQMTITD